MQIIIEKEYDNDNKKIIHLKNWTQNLQHRIHCIYYSYRSQMQPCCIVSYELHSLHCILSTVFYVLYSTDCILCTVFYGLCSMHCILCTLFLALKVADHGRTDHAQSCYRSQKQLKQLGPTLFVCICPHSDILSGYNDERDRLPKPLEREMEGSARSFSIVVPSPKADRGQGKACPLK